MADISDVETAIAEVLAAALYPNGNTQPCVAGSPVRIYRGWPLPGPLAADLSGGTANISVFSVAGASRNTTRWTPTPSVTKGVVTLNVEVSENSVSFSGMGGSTNLAGLLVDNTPYVYRGKDGDTAALVAAVFGEQIRSKRECWTSAATLTVPHAVHLVGRVVADATIRQEWARQAQSIRVSVWCPTPMLRDLICSLLGSLFAETPFITTPDGTSARLTYKSTSAWDDHQDARQYRRDIVLEADYATISTHDGASMLFGDVQLDGRATYS